MIEGDVSYSYSDIFNDSHWVVYQGGLQFFDSKDNPTSNLDDAVNVTFRIFTWGYNPMSYLDEKNKPASSQYKFLQSSSFYKISIDSFKSNFYGYIEAY